MALLIVILIFSLLCATSLHSFQPHENIEERKLGSRRVIDLKGGPESVIWVVQLSDLHFSVFHPERALDFETLVGPALAMIKPALVLITGDLTDAKSKDLLTTKQNEDEWIEYRKVMGGVIERSGLDKNIFYDIRGNHDNFGVPVAGGSFDFFSKYSVSAQLGRSGNVNSVTVQNGRWKHLFVGFDSTMSAGLRGPTNLFGHPSDELLVEIDSMLVQWNSESAKLVTKIAFGHFPLSFSAALDSGKSLKDVFLKHSLSAYLCGHLHTKFGKNLKRHHQNQRGHNFLSQKYIQLNINQTPVSTLDVKDCSSGSPSVEEFWEWEMGDWRKSRVMRVLAIDGGHVSFVDIDFKSGAKRTIILPTFPLDSRVMLKTSSAHEYNCHFTDKSMYENVKALVFSAAPIVSVIARIYDSRYGNLDMVLEALMKKHEDNSSRGDLYSVPWNFRAFEDPSPNRFWLQIEAIDIMGRSSLTELRPFSINGLRAKLIWSWMEFFVMGYEWAALYYPILWSTYMFMILFLLIPIVLLTFSKKQYMYKNFSTRKGFTNGIAWVLSEFCRIVPVWFGVLCYAFSLIFFPWFSGRVFNGDGDRGYMTYKGWAVNVSGERNKHVYIGLPDVMVVVLPHLYFVVLPAILVIGLLAVERGVYRVHFMLLSGKKEDDNDQETSRYVKHENQGNRRSKLFWRDRWMRKLLMVICLAIFWIHLKSCRAMMKAYEMNPFLHFPGYAVSIPLLLAYAMYETKGV